MKNLALRSLSGIIYVALIVGAVLLGNWWFTALMLLFGVLAVVEFQHIVSGRPKGFWQCAADTFDVVAAVCIILFTTLAVIPNWLIFTCMGVLMLYTLVRFTMSLYDKSKTAYVNVAWSTLSLLYIAVPLALLNMVYFYDRGPAVVLAMFIMIWLNDTGAYCVGSTMGKHPMFPRLSPKKSWEGFFGGLAFCLGAGVGAYYLIPDRLPLAAWIGFGAMVCVLSTWGDLFESLLKRSHAIKDSGHLIPGHGGILDRIDSLLFVAVGTYIFFAIA